MLCDDGQIYRQREGPYRLVRIEEVWEVEHQEGFSPFISCVRSSLPPTSGWLFRKGPSTLACSKKTKFLNFILQLCPGLCIYVKNHQKKFQDFWGHSFGPPLILRFSISTFMRRRRRSLLRTFLGVLDSCSVAEWPGNLILTYFEYSWLSVLQKLPELCLIQMTEYKETRNL